MTAAVAHECVLAPTRAAVLAQVDGHQNKSELVRERLLLRVSGQQFFNASKLTLATLSDTQAAVELMMLAANAPPPHGLAQRYSLAWFTPCLYHASW